ncbi:MAG: FtsX-like permease family protein [Firmicutes bacterium]|nr:FtsX-like permease family protein [Bacillota bacterium]
MKKTQRKDAIRNIIKQKVSFFSVLLVIMLGTTSYLGINYASAALKSAGNAFYNDHAYQDIEMIATLGVTQRDIDAVIGVEGVLDAEGVYSTTAQADKDKIHVDVNVVSVTQRLNIPDVLEGRLPEEENECAIESSLAEKMGLSLTDRFYLHSESGENAKFLKRDAFTVVGIIRYSDHIKDAAYIPPTVELCEEAFDMKDDFDPDSKEKYFTKIILRLDEDKTRNVFSKRYMGKVSKVEDPLNDLSLKLAEMRDKEIEERIKTIVSEKDDMLLSAKEELDSSAKKLEEGQKELENAKGEIESNREKLDSSKKELEENKKLLDSAAEQLQSGRQTLDESKEKLDRARKELDEARPQLQAGQEELEEKRLLLGAAKEKLDAAAEKIAGYRARYEQYKNDNKNASTVRALIEAAQGQYDQENQKYEQGNAEYQAALKVYEEKKALFDKSEKEYNESKAKYDEKEAEYNKNKAEYDAKKAEYDKGLELYEQGEEKYKSAQTEYEEAQKEYEEKQMEYIAGQNEYEKAESELSLKKQQLENVEKVRWFEFNINSNMGYLNLDLNAGNLGKLGRTFALLFVVVAAMVCYATIGRQVDEQRKLIGTAKALGFFKSEIFKKYLVFGASACFIGVVCGIAIAYFAMQKAILKGYAGTFTFGEAAPVVISSVTVIALVFSVTLGILATAAACFKLLKTEAVTLMKEKVPAVFKGKASSFGSVYSRLILRNMLSDPKRIAVTSVSIAGCCALLVIGFTLKFSVDSVMVRQYEKIMTYDDNISFNRDMDNNTKENIQKILEAKGCEYTSLLKQNISYNINGKTDVAEFYIIEPEDLESYYNLKNTKGSPVINKDSWQEGVLIQKRIAEVYGVKVGDTMELYDTNAREHEVKIAGIFDNYIGRPMFMSEKYYESVFDIPARENMFFVKLMGSDETSLYNEVSEIKGFKSFERADIQKEIFMSVSTILNSVIAGMIFLAALMASVVLLNLANMYLNEKKRELAVMRINGFTLKQTVAYLSRESVITTLMGIFMGVGFGCVLARAIILGLEKPDLQLAREPNTVAWIISVGITALFSLIINAIVMRKVKNLKLSDVLE